MPTSRAAEKLFDFPRLYRAKFAITGALLALVRPVFFRTLVNAPDVLRAAAMPAGSRICEIGCGDGENYRMVADIVGDVAYTGIDINPKMVDHCRQLHADQRWLCAMPPYEFADGAFDYCIIVNVLHHLNSRQDIVNMLVEAGRIARHVVLFEPLQSENRAVFALKKMYWAVTDGGLFYPRLGDYRALFAAARLELTWERFSAPLRHFYGAILRPEP